MKILRTVAPLAATAVLILCGALPAEVPLVRYSEAAAGAEQGIPTGGLYVPPGSLFDNEQSNASLANLSQNSDGSGTARTADDFILPAGDCMSAAFVVSRIRAQIVQVNDAAQPFGLDLYADRGDGQAPTTGISPFSTTLESGRTALGPFGSGNTLFEASFEPGGIVLGAGATYWLSVFGSDGAVNASSGNNYFAASAGAAGTADNAVFISPVFGYPDWVPAQEVTGTGPIAFSFAVDGYCLGEGGPFALDVPALSPAGASLFAVFLLLAAAVRFRRRFRER